MNQVKWNTYSDHLADMMEGLLIDGAFSDVTLVTEDKHIFKAHKNILSMCSHFFKNLMTFDPKSSAVIYLKGVHFVELKLIMQFVYLGEATINEERMSEFFEVAKSLEIKELDPKMAEAEEGKIDEFDVYPVEEHGIGSNEEIPNKLTSTEDQDISLDNLENNEKSTETKDKEEKIDEFDLYPVDGHVIESKKEIWNEPTSTENHDISLDNLDKDENSIETRNHGKEFLYSCDKCENKYSRSSHLRRHIKAKHEDIKYTCEFCDFQTKIQYHHKMHFEESHVGIRYYCEHCNYEAPRKSSLKRHNERKHEKQKKPRLGKKSNE